MRQEAEEEIRSPGRSREKDIEVQGVPIDPHRHEEERQKIEGDLVTGSVAGHTFAALIHGESSQRDQNDDPHIQIAAPGRGRNRCRAGDEKDDR